MSIPGTKGTVDFVVPRLPPGQRPRPLAADPPDLLWCILCFWQRPALVDFMHVLHGCATLMPTDQEQEGRGLHDTHFWETHPVPVLLPCPQLLSPDEAFWALAHTTEAEELILNSMRFAAVLAVVHDMRMRHLLLCQHDGIHPVLRVRPSESWRFWTFLTLGPQRILAWVLRQAVEDPDSLMVTTGLAVRALGELWCELVPVRGPWDVEEAEETMNRFLSE